jgi:hypothetical protein
MKFVLPRSLFEGACSQKVSKNLKIEGDQVMLPKTDLSLVGTSGPLGVKIHLHQYCQKLQNADTLMDQNYIKCTMKDRNTNTNDN